MDVSVVGTGYVGLVTGAALAHIGHRVVCVDNDESKVEALRQGIIPIHEPGLSDVVKPLLESGALSFTMDLAAAAKSAEVVFICVGTPMADDGAADMSSVEQVARGIGRAMDSACRVIVNKSTVPIGSADRVAAWIREAFYETHARDGFAPDFDVISNPEFLREGTAISDTFYPDRVVLGAHSDRPLRVMQELLAPLIEGSFTVPGLKPPADRRLPVPVVLTGVTSAEMIKYAANAFLVLKISFINEIASICERIGADVTQVSNGIGYDQRIGHRFLQAGLGWGGSCFPKDLSALRRIAVDKDYEPRILEAAIAVNQQMREMAVAKIERELGDLNGRTIGLLGLAFKPNTDDMRYAPSRTIADTLTQRGAVVKAYDPVAMPKATLDHPHIVMASDPYDLACGCDALLLVTDWPQFRALDLPRLRNAMVTPVMVDARNLFDPAQMQAAGFRYVSFGR